MSHRLFIGLPISDRLQQAIFNWERGYSDLPVRWLTANNLHLTLIPPWEAKNVDEVAEQLESFRGSHRGLDVQFNRITFGSDPREPRLIWVEGGYNAMLSGFRADINETLQLPQEERTLLPHITIARFRPETFKEFPIRSLNDTVSWLERFEYLALYESHLSSGGAEYEIVKAVHL